MKYCWWRIHQHLQESHLIVLLSAQGWGLLFHSWGSSSSQSLGNHNTSTSRTRSRSSYFYQFPCSPGIQWLLFRCICHTLLQPFLIQGFLAMPKWQEIFWQVWLSAKRLGCSMCPSSCYQSEATEVLKPMEIRMGDGQLSRSTTSCWPTQTHTYALTHFNSSLSERIYNSQILTCVQF